MWRLLGPILIAIGAFIVWRYVDRSGQKSERLSAPSVTDPAITRVAETLAKTVNLRALDLRMPDSPEIFSKSLEDGTIVLSRGLVMLKMRGVLSPDELGSIIAQELGRSALGFYRPRFWDFLVEQGPIPGLFRGAFPALAVATNWLTGMYFATRVAERRRRAVFESDAWASALLIECGIGIGPQKSALEILKNLVAPAQPGSLAEQLSPIPEFGERITAIEANEARWLRSS